MTSAGVSPNHSIIVAGIALVSTQPATVAITIARTAGVIGPGPIEYGRRAGGA